MNCTTTARCSTALVLVALAACSTGPGQNGMTVRDSAGIVFVEHGPDLPGGVEHWSLESTPVSNIGKAEGGEAYFFTRIVQASALPGGQVLVADRATSDLRIFDSTGRLARRVGRNGGGPGEFQELSWVGVDRSGSIATYDGTLRRISRFSYDGALQQIISLPSSPGVPLGAVVGQFGDGSTLMRTLVGLPAEKDLAKLSTGLVRDSIGLFVVAPDGSQRTPVGRFAGPQSLRAVGEVIAMGPAPFGLRTVIAVADTVFYVSTQEVYEVRAYRKNGFLHRVLRRRVPPQPVNATAKAEWQRQWAERLARFKGPVPPQVTELAKYQTLPDVFPAHGELLVDRVGNLWVEDYRPFPSRDTVTMWTVFSPDGTILARAELPSAQITEIGVDRVVGVWRGEDDVPYVRVYRLVRRSRRATTQD